MSLFPKIPFENALQSPPENALWGLTLSFSENAVLLDIDGKFPIITYH